MTPSPQQPAFDWQRFAIGAGLILAATLASYAPVFSAGFIWDDDMMLTNNPFIKAGNGLYHIWFTTALPDYFPLTSTSLWVEWRLWGLNATGYHVTNVLLHAVTAVVMWRVLALLKIPGAWLAALVFAIHPVNVESVAWITERKNTLSLFFGALAAYWFLDAEAKSVTTTPSSRFTSHVSRYYYLSLAAFLLALLSKTSVVMLPVVLLALAWWQRGKITARDVGRCAPFFVLSLVLGLVTIWFQYHRSIGGDVVREAGFPARLAGAGWAVWFYAYKALLPVKLCFVYPRWEINGASVLAYLPGVTLVGCFILCWWKRRSWGKAWLVAGGCFAVLLLPVLGFFNVYFQRYSLVADHWQYSAIIGIIALVVGGGAAWYQKQKEGGRSALLVLAVGLVIFLGVTTGRQTRIYANSETLWRDTLAKNPACSLAHNNWGLLLAGRGQEAEAAEHYEEALRLPADRAETHNNYGTLLLGQGKVDAARGHFLEALKYNPRFPLTYYNLGFASDRQGKRGEALAYYTKALELKPEHPEAHNNVGCLMAAEGKFDAAIGHFEQALRGRPDFAEVRNNLGSTLVELGKFGEAEAQLRFATRLQPNYADAWFNLGNALFGLRRDSDAAQAYNMALSLKPELPMAHYKLGSVLLLHDETAQAAEHLNAAVQLDPALAEAHYQLAVLLQRQKQAAPAVAHLHTAVRLKPQWLEALNNLAWVQSTHAQAEIRNGAEAIELATRAAALTGNTNAGVLDTLAAAYAETGEFRKATDTMQKAAALASAAGQKELTAQLQTRLELYQAGKPYRTP